MTTKPTNIYGALAAAQAEMTRAKKDTDNPHFRSKFADLASVQDACFPALNKHGFAVYQPLVQNGEELAVKTILAHESGEVLECSIPLILQAKNMQGLGSAITYARRYGLFCMSGVAPDDDDGNTATEQAPAKKAKPAPKQQEETPFDEAPGLEKVEARAMELIKAIRGIKDIDELKGFWAQAWPEIGSMRANGFAEQSAKVEAEKDTKKAELTEAA